MRLIPLAALLFAAVAVSGCEKVSDAAFNARVHSYLMAHPEVIEQAALKLEENRATKAGVALKDKIAQNRAALERDKRDFVANPNGKITVVEFFDYRCGYCRKAAPEIIKLIAANPDVRFVFKELPIFGEESERAAALALAANQDGRYMNVYRAFFGASALNAETMAPALAAEGVDIKTLEQKAGSAEIKQHIADNHKVASAVGLTGTPTFFIGDTAVEGWDPTALNAAIAKARKG